MHKQISKLFLHILGISILLLLAAVPSRAMENRSTEILWDTWGIPHVYAKTNEDMFYAFGYAQMQSHGNLLLDLYGRARGRAAEYWGAENIASDRWVWLNRIPALTQTWDEAHSEQFQRFYDAFAQGINDYAYNHPDRIEKALKVVLPITRRDLLAHILRAVIFHGITLPEVMEDAKEDLPTQSKGSNGWVIAPSKSASGNSMLLINPHLPWMDLMTLYEAHLTSPDYHAYGATFVGTPMLAFAFNESHGWTHTINTHDGEDLFELTLVDGGYAWDEGVKPFEERAQTIFVKQEDGSLAEETFQFKYSLHGPVIAEEGDKAIALR
ncbi:acylase, partial [bacterium]|nr:acylase [bacterium]